MKSRFLGIILIALGLLLNVYFLEYLFSVNKQIETEVYRSLIWLFDIFLVVIGIFQYRSNFTINRKYILFSSISLLIFIVFIEIFFRIGSTFFLSTSDRIIDEYYGWVCKPNYKKEIKYKGYGDKQILYSTKMNGFRSWHKIDPNKKRVFVLGDSMTQGLKVNDNRNYYDILAEQLGDSFQVFSYGCGGYGSLQEYMILDKYFDIIDPDIIIIQTSSNDISDNYLDLEKISLGNNNFMRRPYLINGDIEYHYPYPGNKFIVFLQKNFISFKFLSGRLRIFELLIANKNIDETNSLYSLALETTEQIFKLIKQRIGEKKLFVFESDKNQFINKICKKLDIEFIDTIQNDIIRAQIEGLKINGLPYDSHWNDTGNEIVGNSLSKTIKLYFSS